MPVNDDEYRPLTADELYQRMEENLEELLGFSSQPGSLVKAQLRSEAETLAENQEQALKKVYKAAYLEDAEGKELTKLVKLIGLTRGARVPATGTVRFTRSSPPTVDHVIQRGTELQTDDTDPVKFETTELARINYIDGFEDNDLGGWEGETSAVSINSTSPLTGSHSVELPATSGVVISTADTFDIGTVFEMDVRPTGDSITAIQFARQDASNYFEAVLDANSNDLRLREVKGGAEERNVSTNLTISAGTTYHVAIDWSLYGDNSVKLYESSSKDVQLGATFLEDQEQIDWNEGTLGLKSKDDVATTLLDELTTTAKTVNVEAIEGGIETNLSTSAITIMTNGVSGVDNVVNEVPTGSPNYIDTDLAQFITGQDREEDEQLRKRALENTAIGGAATSTAIDAKVSQVEGVQTTKVFKNKTKSTVDGLPPNSFEAVVYGGKDKEVARAIFESSSVDSTDYGGAHGTETTYTVNSDVLAEPETIHWSRPSLLDLNLTIDLIKDDSYVGDEEIKSRVVEYIGGTDTDETFIPGLQPGDDVYVSILENRIVDPAETGVWEVDSVSIDKDGDGTDDITTTGNGADILAVADSEVTQTDARDGSITINAVDK